MKIDIHTHILPETWPDLDKKYGTSGFIRLDHHEPCKARMLMGDKCFRVIEDNCWSPERRMADCDRDGVHVQVLSTVPVMFSYWAKPADALDLSRLLNDHIAGVVAANPTRFVGLGTVPMQDPQLAASELERCVKQLGMAGVEVGSHINDWNLNERALDPVWETAERLGAAVFVHPWDMMGKDQMQRYWLPWLVGMPAETSRAICSMIFGGVFERYPRLRVAFAHGGGSFPFTVGRVEHGFNVRPDLCAVDNDKNPRDSIGRFYVDSLVHDADALRFLIKLFGADRIALGTDYPFPLGELEPGRLIESLPDISADTRDRLLAGSALEFLGLDRNTFLPDTAAKA